MVAGNTLSVVSVIEWKALHISLSVFQFLN